jgi:hypothetical protein
MVQLYGAFIILRAFFPLVFGVVCYFLWRRLAAEARAAVLPQLVEIDTRAGNIKATLAAGQTTLAAIGQEIEDVATAVEDISASLTVDLGELQIPEAIDPFTLADRLADLLGAEIEPTLEFATRTLTDTYNILGLGQVKGVIDSVLEVMEHMAAAIGITAVAEDASVIAGAIGNMVGTLFKLWLKWRRVVRLFLWVSAVFLALIYVVWLLRSLWRGWALLVGLPDPGPG